MHRSSDRKGRAQLLDRTHPGVKPGAVEVTLDNHADRTAFALATILSNVCPIRVDGSREGLPC